MSDDELLPWPEAGQKLFIDGKNYFDFSHLGWNDYKSQFLQYAKGYKDAADELLKNAITQKNIVALDSHFFPICFLYRQYLELIMKFIFIVNSKQSDDDKKLSIKKSGHNLFGVWKKIKPLFPSNLSTHEIETRDVVEKMIIEFNNFDESSTTFRYPINKEFIHPISSQKRIDLPNLYKRMNELETYFNGCIGKLDERL